MLALAGPATCTSSSSVHRPFAPYDMSSSARLSHLPSQQISCSVALERGMFVGLPLHLFGGYKGCGWATPWPTSTNLTLVMWLVIAQIYLFDEYLSWILGKNVHLKIASQRLSKKFLTITIIITITTTSITITWQITNRKLVVADQQTAEPHPS